MSRHDLLLHSVAYSDVAETRVPIDALIWTGLRQAFPLHLEGGDNDEAFRVLLAALARRHGGCRQSSTSFAGVKS